MRLCKVYKKILLLGIFLFIYGCSSEPNTTIINNTLDGTIYLDDVNCVSDESELSWECSVTGRYSENGVSSDLSYKWSFFDDEGEHLPSSVTGIENGSSAKYVFDKYPDAINGNKNYKVKLTASYKGYQLNREVNLNISNPVVSKIMILPGDTVNSRVFKPVIEPAVLNNITYTWQFGDGSNQTTSNDSISHEYSTENSYDYTVTVVASSDKFRSPVSSSVSVDLRPYTISGVEIVSSYLDSGYIRTYTFTSPARAYIQEGSQVISKELDYNWELINRGKVIKSSLEKDFLIYSPDDIKFNDNTEYKLKLTVSIKDNPASLKTTYITVKPRYVNAEVSGTSSSTNGKSGAYSANIKFSDNSVALPSNKFQCQWYVNGFKSGNAVNCEAQKTVSFSTDHASKDGKVPVKINVEISSELMGSTSTSSTFKVSVVPTEQDIVKIKDIGLKCTSPDNGLTQNCSVNFTFNEGVSAEDQQRIKNTRNVQFRYLKNDGSNNIIASTTSGGTASFKLEYPKYVDITRAYNGYYDRYVPVEVFIGWNGYAVKYGIFQIADLYVRVPGISYNLGYIATTGNVSPGNGSAWIGSGPKLRFANYKIPDTYSASKGCTINWRYYMEDIASGGKVTQNTNALSKFYNKDNVTINGTDNAIDLLPAIKESNFTGIMEGNPFLNENGFGVEISCPSNILPSPLRYYGKGLGAGSGTFASIETGTRAFISPRIKFEVNKCVKKTSGQYEITYTATVDEGSREMIANNRYSRYYVGFSNVEFTEKSSGKTFISEIDNDVFKFDKDYVYTKTMLLNSDYNTSEYTLKSIPLYLAEYKYPSLDFNGEYNKIDASSVSFQTNFCVNE